jgi:predicted Rossmann fold flavoprotein
MLSVIKGPAKAGPKITRAGNLIFMKEISQNEMFDIAVIGGGPAGMMAAISASKSGAKVVLIEKNEKLGRKLLLTGKGRCNITQAEFDNRKLVENYGVNGKFLFSALSKFGAADTMAFFEENGLKLKTERGARVFPQSDKSADVLNTLLKCLKKHQVEIITGVAVVKIENENNSIICLKLKTGKIRAQNYIFCTGGKSYPQTGSSGEAFKWLKDLGHRVTKLSPSLTPIKIQEPWIKDLQGLSLKNVEISLWKNNKKNSSRFGEMIFTHFGVSGPVILDISREVGNILSDKRQGAKLSLDLKPALDFRKLDERIQRDFQKYNNKLFRNALDDLLPQKLIPVIIKLSQIDPSKHVNLVSREERQKLTKLLKNLEMTATGLFGFDFAIVTSGGVDLKEVDPKTMQSKIIKNLYFAGEILDLDGPTGGYNLQVAWTTGFVAGKSAAEKL